ncbi:hypothetical protein LIER_12131 [Lithospermum erythrorhizon]|uniref:Uncharacterized protein n=1 Tax=Lithospermum erythrorhizon TaxID=34254 RepID=A0AAV3PQM1_LITER
MKFLGWYLKIAIGSAIVGGSMEMFFITSCFLFSCMSCCLNWTDDKVTVLEEEKRAWENYPEAQAMREALNP